VPAEWSSLRRSAARVVADDAQFRDTDLEHGRERATDSNDAAPVFSMR
jgi:hypothetical protein